MTCNLLFFPWWEDANQAARQGIADGIARRAVPCIVEPDAHPRQATADRRPHFAVVFSDAARENDEIGSVKRGDHRGYLLSHGIAKHLNGEARIGVRDRE